MKKKKKVLNFTFLGGITRKREMYFVIEAQYLGLKQNQLSFI